MKNFTKMFLAACLLTVFAISLNAQTGVAINSTGAEPDNSSILDVSSTTKGFLPPRMTTVQRNAISSPAEGLVIYNTDEKTLNIYNGTLWGLLSPLVCGQPFTDPRDGKIYNTSLIGTQCWMTQNLAYLPSVVGPGTSSETDPYYYVYGYNGTNVATAKANASYGTYGVLYNWPASTIACPTGWHLPNDAEWTTLSTYLGGEEVAGGKMKESGFTHWTDPNTGATNTSGFTALPAGWCISGLFAFQVQRTTFWSATLGAPNPMRWSIFYNGSGMYSDDGFDKSAGFSVRCINN